MTEPTPVYLCAIVNGQQIRYLHSTPESREAADELARDLNRGLRMAAYIAIGDDA